MAEIFPFRAYRYNAARVDPAKVLTQPYDKITPAMAEKYAAASPYNLIPVEKGKTLPGDSPANNVYTRAAKALEDWIRDGVLVQDAAPSLYAYFQEYTVPGTSERRVRKGFIAAGRIEDYSAGVVFRHEQTLSGPKADRMELLRHTQTHTGQLFMLYNDPAGRVDALLDAAGRGKPDVEIRDEYDVVHRLWPVTDARTIETIQRELADKKLVIADGHHRYETAMAYRDECRARAGHADPNAPYEKVMMTLFNTAGKGLTILPTHRVVANVPGFSRDSFRAALADIFDSQSYPFATASDRPKAYETFRRDLRTRQGTTSDRRIRRRRSIHDFRAQEGSESGSPFAGRLTGAKATGRGAAAPVDPRARPGNHARCGENGKEPHLRKRDGHGDRRSGPGAGANLFPAEFGERGNRGGNGHGRRSVAAEIDGLFSEADERDYDVSAEVVIS